MLKRLILYRRWARRKLLTGPLARLNPWNQRRRNDAAGDNFPGIERALVISRTMRDPAFR